MVAISVIIPCYNQEKYIAECLDSVVCQTFTDFEAIVIDDGSKDNSLKIIKQYTVKYPYIKLISQPNQGVIAARTNGIIQAKGKYIYNLDGDDIIASTMLEKAYQAIEAGKGDIISCKNREFNSKSDLQTKGINKYFYKPDKFNMLAQNCLNNSALYRKSDFEKCGGYDHTFDKGWEDYDLWLNMIIKHNLKAYRIPEVLFFNRINVTGSRNIQAMSDCKELTNSLYKKYPKMRIVRLISRFTDVRRFLWQKKITKSGKVIIKVCKIPVFCKKVRNL